MLQRRSLLWLLLGTAARAFQPQHSSNSPPRQMGGAGLFIRSVKSSRLASADRSRDRKGQFFPASDYDSINDLLEAAADVLSSGGSLPTASIWSRLARLMSQRQPYQKLSNPTSQKEQTVDTLKLQVGAIFKHTIKSFDAARPKEMTTIILSMAKIAVNALKSRKQRRVSNFQKVFGNLFFDGQNINEVLFRHLAIRANDSLPHFNARELSNLAYAYALLGYDPILDEDHTLLENIADASIICGEQFNAQDVSNMVWAFATLKIPQPKLFQSLGDVVSLADLETFQPQAIANTVWAFATLDVQHDGLFMKVGDHMSEMNSLRAFYPQALSNIVWAYATTDIKHSGLFEKVGNHVSQLDSLQSFEPQALSNTLWAYASLGYSHSKLFNKIGDHIALGNLKSFKPQDISNTLWAYATLNLKRPDLLEKVGDHISGLDSLKAFNPQALSNTVWAYATLDHTHAALFRKVGETIDQLNDLNLFKPQDMSNIVWAHATLGVTSTRLFVKVGDYISHLDDLQSFKPQELANIVWAYATSGVQHSGLFNKVGDHIASLADLRSFNAQALANVAWAYATSSTIHARLFDKIGDHIVNLDDLKSFKPQTLSNIVWAYATNEVQHHVLFEKVRNLIVGYDDLGSFNAQALANIVWAYSNANVPDLIMFKKVEDYIATLEDLGSFDSHALANIAWSYAVANADAPMIFNDNFTKELLDREQEFTIKELRQLYQWHLWQACENQLPGLPKALSRCCRQAFSGSNTKPSRFQSDVVSQLRSINLSPVEEYLTASGYSIDALVDFDGTLIGIEVDGPSHFIHLQPTSRTLLKRRQISTIDEIPLVSVPYWEWDALGNDNPKKQQYLQCLLDSIKP
ncbi:hypothetical protein ACHAWO_007960 [Cyclotella atomus]|uniref:RAP domain-containing protein n=1 Tax=Cyclotella atomus TaxID=382360 RepID=A0ABD3MZL1_9STRA